MADTPETRNLRVDYDRDVLHRSDLDDDPLVQFGAWLHDAIEIGEPEPNAFALATVTPEGLPNVRVVLLKGFDQRGLRFFTNYESNKGRDLEQTPRAAGTFWWPTLQRQVRVSGGVTRVERDESETYFHSRPRASQLGAVASPQSRVLPDRETLETALRTATERFEDRQVDMPQSWGGYRIGLERLELWQGRRSRLHDRFVYSRVDDGSWRRERLAP
ncbi:MAG: pyridoxamine 5'-phosphate oxidase [Acidobacteriota bacterium]